MTNTDDIPDTIDFFAKDSSQAITFTDDEKEQLKNTYQHVLEGRLEGKEFIKSEDGSTTNYSVEITNQELVDIVSAFLETLKNDQILLPKLEQSLQEYSDMMNQSSTEEVTMQSMIQDIIDQLGKSEIQDGTTQVTVSQTDKMLSGITFVFGENEMIKLAKINNQDTLTYRIEIVSPNEDQQTSVTMYFNASYQGLEQLESVNKNYEMGVSMTADGEEQNVTYTFNCTDTFNDGINIEDYGEDETEILNEYDSEQMATLFTAIGQRITEVNVSQMEEIGFTEYGNPILYACPMVSTLFMLYNNQVGSVVDENSLREAEIQSFNQKFTQYEGLQRGPTISALLQTVLSNNVSATEDSRKVEVTGDIIISKDATEVPTDSVDNSLRYNVQVEYSEGVVSQIIITQE